MSETNDSKAKVEGGVRKYLRRTPIQRWRQWLCTRNLGSRGEGLFVDPNVQFMRHPEKMRLGDHVIVKEGARLCATNPEASIQIGDWTTIGYHTFLFASSGIKIGANCLIAPFCYFVDANHGIRAGELIREQPLSAEPIVVGDDVWVGTGATILRGVNIGSGAVIGAGAVVRENVPENAIVSGAKSEIVDHRR